MSRTYSYVIDLASKDKSLWPFSLVMPVPLGDAVEAKLFRLEPTRGKSVWIVLDADLRAEIFGEGA